MASKNNLLNVDDVIGMIFAEDNRDLGEESAEEETDDSWSETDEPSFYDNSNESTGKADDACFRDSALCDDMDLQPVSKFPSILFCVLRKTLGLPFFYIM